MLRKLKVVSKFLIECFMFTVAGLLGVIFIPFVIGAAWLELFREAKNEFMGRVPEVHETNEEVTEEV